MININIEKLIDILIQLRSDSMQLSTNPSQNEVKALMHKYDMLFLGANFNSINSIELCHSIKNHFNLESNIDELNSLLPNACECLNMRYTPLVEMGKLGKTLKPDCYSIILW